QPRNAGQILGRRQLALRLRKRQGRDCSISPTIGHSEKSLRASRRPRIGVAMPPICRLPLLLLAAALAAPSAEISHGPILGRLSSDGVGVWVRTTRPGEFRVRYGAEPTDLKLVSGSARTRLEEDNTGWVHITGL